jgi:hypothetical protein
MPTTNVHQEIRGFLVETFLFGRNEELTDDAPLLDTFVSKMMKSIPIISTR